MNLVKFFLQDIVIGKFNNPKEAEKMYLDNIYGDEVKIRRSDNRTDREKDVYDRGL